VWGAGALICLTNEGPARREGSESLRGWRLRPHLVTGINLTLITRQLGKQLGVCVWPLYHVVRRTEEEEPLAVDEEMKRK
jgi:hypothetical protein